MLPLEKWHIEILGDRAKVFLNLDNLTDRIWSQSVLAITLILPSTLSKWPHSYLTRKCPILSDHLLINRIFFNSDRTTRAAIALNFHHLFSPQLLSRTRMIRSPMVHRAS
jgi:hypothetical protein